ncbi:MAG: YbhB/YbcL family Raf kinase inhibitor-like protein [Candidatus Nanohaloarchaea archaeon]|nr:YbhB/YbcL family Raf kinase inhibitor-like protein [Candidatus Nanohaloarchaea archaeon]
MSTSDLTLTSPAFDDGGRIPQKYGYEHANVNPPLTVSGVPEGAESLALVMDDPDAKPVAGKVWDHWVLYGIPPNVTDIREDEAAGVEGQNDYGEQGYGGPNPPDKQHTYVFTLYALDTELDLEPGATKEELERAIDGHVLAKDVLRGTYAP